MPSAPTSDTRQLLFLLTLAAFASSASFRVCDPMLPQLAGQFAASTAEVALIITSFTIAYGAMQLVYGPLGERFERFRIVTRATALCAVGSLGAALAPSLEMLTACRILTGVAAAGIIPMSMATVSDLVPAEQRQATLARLFSGQILGMVFGQVLGGLCVDFGLWRLAFGVLTGLYLLIAFALWRKAHLGRRPAARPARPAAWPASTGGPWECSTPARPGACWPAFSWRRCWSSACSPSCPSTCTSASGWRCPRPRCRCCCTARGPAVLLRGGAPGPADQPLGVSGGRGRAGGAGQRCRPLRRAPGLDLRRGAAVGLRLLPAAQRPAVPDHPARAGSPQPGPGLVRLTVLRGAIGGVSAAGWLVDQGRITLVFAIAALGMPLLGLAAGRQIRPA
jgi:MFS family permease